MGCEVYLDKHFLFNMMSRYWLSCLGRFVQLLLEKTPVSILITSFQEDDDIHKVEEIQIVTSFSRCWWRWSCLSELGLAFIILLCALLYPKIVSTFSFYLSLLLWQSTPSTISFAFFFVIHTKHTILWHMSSSSVTIKQRIIIIIVIIIFCNAFCLSSEETSHKAARKISESGGTRNNSLIRLRKKLHKSGTTIYTHFSLSSQLIFLPFIPARQFMRH